MKHPVEVLEKQKKDLINSIEHTKKELNSYEGAAKDCKERLAELRQSVAEVDAALHVLDGQNIKAIGTVKENPFAPLIQLATEGLNKRLEEEIMKGVEYVLPLSKIHE